MENPLSTSLFNRHATGFYIPAGIDSIWPSIKCRHPQCRLLFDSVNSSHSNQLIFQCWILNSLERVWVPPSTNCWNLEDGWEVNNLLRRELIILFCVVTQRFAMVGNPTIWFLSRWADRPFLHWPLSEIIIKNIFKIKKIKITPLTTLYFLKRKKKYTYILVYLKSKPNPKSYTNWGFYKKNWSSKLSKSMIYILIYIYILKKSSCNISLLLVYSLFHFPVFF